MDMGTGSGGWGNRRGRVAIIRSMATLCWTTLHALSVFSREVRNVCGKPNTSAANSGLNQITLSVQSEDEADIGKFQESNGATDEDARAQAQTSS